MSVTVGVMVLVGVTVGVTVFVGVIVGVTVGVTEFVGVGVGDKINTGHVGTGVGINTLPQAFAAGLANEPMNETFLISKLQAQSPVEKLIPGNKIEGEASQLLLKATS